MSTSIRWINASTAHPVETDDDFHDAYGQTVEDGLVGIELGEEVVIEGTVEDLRAFAKRLLGVIPDEDPETESDVIARVQAAGVKPRQLDDEGWDD